MKLVSFGSFLSVLIVSALGASSACVESADWPDRPCYDTSPFPPLGEQREAWQGYYDYKGAMWMEAKRLEMDEAVKSGEVSSWASESEGNFNVWRYYYLNGRAPGLQTGDYEIPAWRSPYLQVAAVAAALASFFTVYSVMRAKKRRKNR